MQAIAAQLARRVFWPSEYRSLIFSRAGKSSKMYSKIFFLPYKAVLGVLSHCNTEIKQHKLCWVRCNCTRFWKPVHFLWVHFMKTPLSPSESVFWRVESTWNGKKEIDFGLLIFPIYSGFLLGVESCPHMIFSICLRAFVFSFLPLLLLLSELCLSIVFSILLKDCHPMYNNWLLEWCLLCTEYSESLTLLLCWSYKVWHCKLGYPWV